MKKIIFISIILILGISIVVSYQNLQYEKDLKEVKKTYNEQQEQCDIVGVTENYLYIKRYFHDDGDYSNWRLTNLKTKKTYNFSLNKDGVGGLVGLKNGEYTLREISNQCNDDLDMNEYYLKFSEDNKSYEFIPSSIDESALVILILDENGNGVPNIKIKLYDNSAKLVLSAKSSDKGVIAFEKLSTKDSNLYYVVQDGIDNPQKFFVQIKKDGAVGLKLNLNNEGYLE